MAIKDLEPKTGNVNLEVDVVEKGEVREFQKFGRPGRVCTAVVQDESGKCNFSLWNEQVDQVNVGDRLKLTDGYVNEWQGEKQLTTGRNGKIEILSSGNAEKAEEAPAQEPSQEEVEKEDIE